MPKQLNAEEAQGIPLAEIDSKVAEDTFCMISKSFGQTFVHRFSRGPSLNVFIVDNPVRRVSIAFTTHICYHLGLMVIVLGNLINLALPNTMPLYFERISTIIYLIEAVYQSISRGFVFGTYSYLKNPWMCFDFIITMLSLPTLELSNPQIFAIQSLRGIRILNLITILPGVRTVAKGILLSMSRMLSVTVIFFTFLILVAISSKHIFKGIMLHKCVNVPSNIGSLNISYSEFVQDPSNWLTYLDDIEYRTCGNLTGAQKCPNGYVCLPNAGYPSIMYDTENFDNIWNSLMNGLCLVTCDEWDSIFDETNQAVGLVCALFFVPVIFFGSFCILNLMLVVVVTSYEHIQATLEKENQSVSLFTKYSRFQFDITKLSLYSLQLKKESLKQVFEERDNMADHNDAINRAFIKALQFIPCVNQHSNVKTAETYGRTESKLGRFRMLLKDFTLSPYFRYFMLGAIIANTVVEAIEHNKQSEEMTEVIFFLDKVFLVLYLVEMILLLIVSGYRYFYNFWNILDTIVVVEGIVSLLFDVKETFLSLKLLRLLKLLKVQKEWSALHRLISVIMDSFANIIQLVIVMLLAIAIFAIFANRSLGPLYDYQNNPEKLRWSFATYGGSLFVVFKIFTGEWIEDMFHCLRKTKNSFCPILFTVYYIIGKLVITNLFAALIIQSFDSSKLQLIAQKKKTNSESSESQWNMPTSSIGGNRLMARVKRFVISNTFEYCVIVMILSSCLMMILEEADSDKHSHFSYYVKYLNYMITFFFTMEVILRWIAVGFKHYFTHFWTCFDFFLIVGTISEILADTLHIFNYGHSLVGLEILRALRLFRLIKRFEGMRVIVKALVLSMLAIFRILVVSIFIWIPFSIIGIHSYKGKFYYCIAEGGIVNDDETILKKSDCLEHGYEWLNAFYNYDHIFNSFLSLLQLAFFSNWALQVEHMVDSPGNDLLPIKDYDPKQYIFAVLFILIGGYLGLNLFVGVAVDSFQNMQKYVEHVDAVSSLSKKQKTYYTALLKISKRKPIIYVKPPFNKCALLCYHVVHAFWFRMLIFLVICANTVEIALDSVHNFQMLTKAMWITEQFYTCVYILEFLIKIVGLRKYYFNDYWNIFDLSIIFLYILGDVIQHSWELETNLMSFVYAFRIMRVSKLLRLYETFIGLRQLVNSMQASFHSLLNTSMLMFIIIFIYSSIGRSLFSHIRVGVIIHSHSNFETILDSALLLFRLSTGEGWTEAVENLSVSFPDCDPDKKPYSDCGNKVVAVLFIFSYIFLTNTLLVNIFIAIILESYQEAVAEEKHLFKEDNLISFYDLWKEFDPEACHFISYHDLATFLDRLISDLRIAKPNKAAITYMNCPVTQENMVHCLYVLKGIIKIKYGEVEDSQNFRYLCNLVDRKHKKMFPELKSSMLFVQTTMRLGQMIRAAKVIESHFIKKKQQKQANHDIKKASSC